MIENKETHRTTSKRLWRMNGFEKLCQENCSSNHRCLSIRNDPFGLWIYVLDSGMLRCTESYIIALCHTVIWPLHRSKNWKLEREILDSPQSEKNTGFFPLSPIWDVCVCGYGLECNVIKNFVSLLKTMDRTIVPSKWKEKSKKSQHCIQSKWVRYYVHTKTISLR